MIKEKYKHLYLVCQFREIKTIRFMQSWIQCKKSEKPRMKEILLAYKKLNENATAQAYTFAIRTRRHTNPKLQKSILLVNPQIQIIEN